MAPTSIDAERLWQRLMALAEIGATPGGGVDRQALCLEETAAWQQLIGWAQRAGAEAFADRAGNLFLRLSGESSGAPAVLIGSHIDTQPRGGRFDGAYGVVAALEVLTTLAQSEERLGCDLIVVAWMNEEGSRFAPGMMGSEVFCGVRSLEQVRAVRDIEGASVAQALDAQLARFSALAMVEPGFVPLAYIEAHIEQGPVLEREARMIGVVSGIQGKRTYRVTIEGAAGHAGTQPMAERQDALIAFSGLARLLDDEIGRHDDVVKFTIGRIEAWPNAPSVVAERVVFSIDLRHPRQQTLDMLGARLEAICASFSTPCRVINEPLVVAPGNEFDRHLQRVIASCAEQRGYPARSMLSAAGHDARHLASICPAAMIFIPCRDGASHVEHEWAEPEHVAAGANVLLDAVTALLVQREEDVADGY